MINKIIKFGATGCGPCKMMDKSLEEFSTKSDINIESYDVEEDDKIALAYNVRSVPSTFFLHNNTIVGKKTGAMTVKQIEEYIEELNKETT